jgi:hypothetical protein
MREYSHPGFNHKITKAEFDYMAKRLHGTGQRDIHKFMDHALTTRKTEFYDSESHKCVAYYNGQKCVACAKDDSKAVKLGRKELGKSKCV